jgi:hypothetical protein
MNPDRKEVNIFMLSKEYILDVPGKNNVKALKNAG